MGLRAFCWSGLYLVEHSSSSATALITDTRTVHVFARGVIVCVTACHRTRLSHTSLFFVRFEVSVYYYYYYYYYYYIHPSTHIRLLNDDKTHQTQYENKNVSTIAYIT